MGNMIILLIFFPRNLQHGLCVSSKFVLQLIKGHGANLMSSFYKPTIRVRLTKYAPVSTKTANYAIVNYYVLYVVEPSFLIVKD